MTRLYDKPAHELLDLLNGNEVTAEEIMVSVFQRIDQVEGDLPSTTLYPPAYPSLKDDPVVRHQARRELKRRAVHAYISLYRDRAMESARESDRKRQQGKAVGKLEGIPLAVKDLFCARDTHTTAASRILAPFVAPYDSTAVGRLKEQGAIVVGKTNLDEFAFGSSSESSAFQPTTANPWDTLRTAGGSSGGSAAAVSAGEAIVSLGTDTSGSIRQPAAFCGVVGVKPTYGRVSRYGLVAFASSLDCVGPITKDVRDGALMLNILAGADGYDATTASLPVPDFTRNLGKSIKGMRIGWPRQYFEIEYPDEKTGELRQREIDREVASFLQEARRVLQAAGAEIVDIELPSTRYGIPCYFVISRIEAMSNLHRYDGVKYGYRVGPEDDVKELTDMYRRTRGVGFGDQPHQRVLMGMYLMSTLYRRSFHEKAMLVRARIRYDFDQAFEKVDCIMAPTSPFSAFPLQRAAAFASEVFERSGDGEGGIFGDTVLMQYADCLTVPASHAGLPAISIPCGIDTKGLPVGLQIISRAWDEETMFQVAYAYEQATDWHKRVPPLGEPAAGGKEKR